MIVIRQNRQNLYVHKTSWLQCIVFVTSMLTCSAHREDRKGFTVCPATEKARSDGAELAGTDKYFLASMPSTNS